MVKRRNEITLGRSRALKQELKQRERDVAQNAANIKRAKEMAEMQRTIGNHAAAAKSAEKAADCVAKVEMLESDMVVTVAKAVAASEKSEATTRKALETLEATEAAAAAAEASNQASQHAAGASAASAQSAENAARGAAVSAQSAGETAAAVVASGQVAADAATAAKVAAVESKAHRFKSACTISRRTLESKKELRMKLDQDIEALEQELRLKREHREGALGEEKVAFDEFQCDKTKLDELLHDHPSLEERGGISPEKTVQPGAGSGKGGDDKRGGAGRSNAVPLGEVSATNSYGRGRTLHRIAPRSRPPLRPDPLRPLRPSRHCTSLTIPQTCHPTTHPARRRKRGTKTEGRGKYAAARTPSSVRCLGISSLITR